MSKAERDALARLVDSVSRQLPKPTQQPNDDAEMATEEAQRIVTRGTNDRPSSAG